MIILGERHFKVLGFALVHADHLLFKAGNKCAGTYHEFLSRSGAAVEFYAVDATAVIEIDDIAVFDGAAFYLDFSGCLLERPVDLLLNVVRRNIILNFVDFNTLVCA